jgi:predicted RNA-binding Zn-ribbon protein involved in translation (DUF1610 family)
MGAPISKPTIILTPYSGAFVAGELSEDGKWIWNGSEWKPFAPPEVPEITAQSAASFRKENLVSCRDCGHEISKKAHSCPNCGAPRKILIRVNSNKFEEPMHRDIELGLFIVGLLLWIAVAFFSPFPFFQSTAICSITLASVFLVDVFYLFIKYDWQTRNGKSGSLSLVMMVINAILGVLCIGSMFVFL